ncbi:MAG: tetratricopeptide repeat protein [Mariniblastus sp.]
MRRLIKSIQSEYRRIKDRAKRPRDWHDRQLGFAATSLRILKAILLFPFRVILAPFTSLGLFHDTGVELRHDAVSKNWRKRLQRFGKQILWAPYRSVVASFSFLKKPGKKRLWTLLYLLPALLMVGLLGFVMIRVFVLDEAVMRRYQQGAQSALQDKDFPLAKTYFTRLMSDGELSPRQKLAWVDILAKTGDNQQAEEKLNELAPFNRVGFSPAHELKAQLLAKSIGRSDDPDLLPKLHWHLKNSVSETPILDEAWAKYYLAVEDYDNAIVALKKAASVNPGFYLMLARLYQVRRENPKRLEALLAAEKAYSGMLDLDQFDGRSRIALASVLLNLNRMDQAEQYLLQGMRIRPDDMIKTATADFYVMKHDRSVAARASIKEQVNFLIKAVNADPNFQPVFNRVMNLYSQTKDSESEVAELRKTFVDLVTGGSPTPMAHLVLSNFMWDEGKFEESKFHLEQAYKLDKTYVFALNNLAWVLSQNGDNADLERALGLIETAVTSQPENPVFRDTYGSILLQLERYQDAAVEFGLALKGRPNSTSIHKNLSIVYEKLGMKELSEKHLEIANSAK